MRLYVYVLEGRGMPVENLYVKLYLGKHKSKTRVVKNCKNPVWNEEFVFRVQDLQDELGVSVFHHQEESGFFSGSAELVGRVKIPISSLVAEENQTLPPTWFSLENSKSRKFVNYNDCGKILLTFSLHGEGHDMPDQLHDSYSSVKLGEAKEAEDHNVLLQYDSDSRPPHRKQPDAKHIVKSLANRLEKLFSKNEEAPKSDNSSDKSTVNTPSDYEDSVDSSPNYSFEEAIATFQSKNIEQKMIESLSGGVLIDQSYAVATTDLNMFLFAPNSQFKKDLAELQGTTDMQEEPWTWKSGDMLARIVTYTKAATKLVKAVKAIEDQKYIMANGNEFAVTVSVSTPDVPYGNTFKVELLYKIMAGPDLSSGEPSSHLVVSWGVNFIQNTMMKGMIESGIKQGLKESFDQFAELLAQSFKVADSKGLSGKDQMLATLQTDQQSDWVLSFKYFCNFTVISAALMLFYVLVHIFFCSRQNLRGLEFKGLDLPDSVGELITCGILVLQLERVYYMVSHFVQARLKRGSDQGVKGQGDGWVLTVALIEGVNLASLETTGFSDPYVVFTCNGKTRTSSVKLQTDNPQWNEILEFDAMEEPPSMLDVEVFDFDGPFDPAASLGHAEVNFLKQSPSELADVWVSLEGKLAQSAQSKLHLRMFLDNNNGLDTIKEHLTKMEKEVGKKLNLRSPHRSSTFQKLFHLPPDEYLISDFSCSLRRKLLLQGRLYLSARIVGFYANMFGHKTKFFYLWEDIEDIHVLPPSLSSVGSPTLVIVLRKGRGVDARHGAKVQDKEGRLRFYFQSFVSFNVASRTVLALWRTRTLTPEQRAQIADEQQDADEQSVLFEDSNGSNDEVLRMSKVYSAELPVDMKALMTMFDGEDLEYRVMGKSGCLNYVTTNWDPIKPDLFERRLFYKFGRHISIYGGEVSATQQKSPLVGREGWIINEIMVFHNVPFDDHFRVHFKYQIEQSEVTDVACKCEAYISIRWLKSTKFQHMITRNVTDKFTHRLQEIFELAEREISLGTVEQNV